MTLTPTLKFTYHFPDDFHAWPEETKRRMMDRIANSAKCSVELWLNQHWDEFVMEDPGEDSYRYSIFEDRATYEMTQDVVIELLNEPGGYVDENDENPIRNPEGFQVQIRLVGDEGPLGDSPVMGLHPAYVISDDGEVIV